LDSVNKIAGDVTNSLEIAHFIRNIYIENTNSPWDEKALIKRKKDCLDVKITIWEDDRFLYGRIYRLFLYIYDVLNPDFQYTPVIAPDENKEPKMKDRHNQIWSIYVDSRVERKGIETFYDKFLRRNVFIDIERELTWNKAGEIFQKLWQKDVYTYPQITDYTYNFGKLMDMSISETSDLLENEINKFLPEPNVQKHIDKLPSSTFRNFTKELLNFTAYNCKDIFIESSYFGISIAYQKRVVIEIIPTTENILYLTLFNTASNSYETSIVTEGSNITELQEHIKEMYNGISMHSHF
jgi:hypothetical protein